MIDWIAVILAWLVEVPSGVLADRMGRKWLVFLAMLFVGLGCLINGFASSFTQLLFGNVLYLIGFSLHSGAAEALVYESLTSERLPAGTSQEFAYERVVATSGALALVASVLAVAVGAVIYRTHGPAAPFFLQGAVVLCGALAGLAAVETVVYGATRPVQVGSRYGVLKTFRLVPRSLFAVAVVSCTALGVYELSAWSMLRPLMATKFGFDEDGYAVIINVGLLAGALFTRILPHARELLGDMQGFIVLGGVLGGLFFLSGFNLGVVGGGVLVAMIALASLLRPWSSVLVNVRVVDEHRATVLSLMSALARVPFLMLGAILPYLTERGFLNQQLWVLGALAVCATGLVLRYREVAPSEQ